MKRCMSILTAILLTMCMIIVPVTSVVAVEPTEQANTNDGESISGSNTENDVSVTSTNGFGNLLGEELAEKQAEQQENRGNNIFSVDIQNNTANVNFETTVPATVLVAIYDEGGNRMLTSATKDVAADTTNAVIALDGEKIPEYFYVRAYLIEPDSFKPLSTVYESPTYTKEMQEFLRKTTDDFDADKVVNFDNDKKNNFAVYSEDTKIITESTEHNQVISADDENLVYVIGNIDSTVSSLQSGDVFAQTYGEDGLLIVKVDTININGTTATIKGQNTSMDEVFDYVKIDSISDMSDMEVDTAEMDEGLTYMGLVEPHSTSTGASAARMAIEGEGSAEKFFEYKLDKEFSHDHAESSDGEDTIDQKVKATGTITFKITAKVKYYLSFDEKYLELSLADSLKLDVSVSASVEAKLHIGYFGFSPVPGVFVELHPCVVFKMSAKIDLNAELKATISLKASSKTGITKTSPKPELKATLSFEGTIYIGISLEPKLVILHEKVAKASLTAEAGIEAKGTLKSSVTVSPDGVQPSWVNESEHHECLACVQGEIYEKFTLKGSVTFANKFKLEINLVDAKLKLSDFYYSIDHQKFGFGICPYKTYKVDIDVESWDGTKKLGGAVLEYNGQNYTADEKGHAVIFLPNGTSTVNVSKEGYETMHEPVYVSSKAMKTTIRLLSPNGDPNAGQGTSSEDDPFANYFSKLDVSIKDVQMNGNTTAVITSNGSLYMFGNNTYGEVGCGLKGEDIATPRKILNNIKMVSVNGANHTIAVATNGDLYTWGRNNYGQLGDGTTIDSCVPVKIMSNVKYVSAGTCSSYAITENGDLYSWGYNAYGQLGNGTTNDSNVPQKIMRNIASVYGEGNSAAVITTSCDLYTFGRNVNSSLGIGRTTDCSTPIRILKNVKDVYTADGRFAILTNNQELYCWGYNGYGQIGNGTTNEQISPVKIMDNIVTIAISYYHTLAITKSGDLYVWGLNNCGQIGNDSKTNQYYPVKIMDNIVSISSGYEFTAAVTKSGQLYTWGSNHFGQLGVDKPYGWNQTTPEKIMDNCAKVFCSGVSTAVITYDNGVMDGYLYTFGDNDYGHLGNGTYMDQYKPVRITLSGGKSTSTSAGTMTPTELTKTYSNLVPNSIYNFYVMKSRTEQAPLSAENLYYISQETADENGMLSITYTPTEAYETADRFVVAMDKVNIASANAEIADLIYTGEEQFVEPVISLDELELTEGVDYELTGDYSATEAGEYTVVINGIGKYRGTLSLTYSVIKEFLNQSDIDRDLIILGDEITITAKAVGGVGDYRYNYYFRSLSDPYWSILDIDTTDSTLTFEPYKSGQFYIRVDVKDSSATVKSKVMLLDVKSRSLVNTSTLSATKIDTGKNLYVTCSAEGGTGSYQYGVYYKNIFDNKWKTAQKYGNNAMISIPFEMEGMFDICVKVKDSSGSIARQYYGLTVENEKILPLKSKSSLSQTTIKLGDSITIKAAATGGKGQYTYAVYYKTANDDTWHTAQSFGENDKLTFTPEQQTVYDICVKVKDETGKTVKKYFTLKVVSPILANVSKLSSENIDLGQSVTLMGGGNGGDAPYTYAFLYRKEGASNWSLLGTKYGTESTANYTPKAEGTYDIRINVRDNTGTTATKEFKLSVVERLDPLVNNSTLSAESITLGESVKVTASATGGKTTYKYAYYYRRVGTEKWTISGTEFGTAKTATIKPAKAVDYEVKVVVKDSKDQTAEKLFTLKVSAPAALENTSTISSTDGSAKVGQAITINGSATGGTGTYKYAYYFKKSALTDWHVIGTEFTTKATSSYSPSSATSYDIRIVVKDGAGTTAEKIFTVKAVK